MEITKTQVRQIVITITETQVRQMLNHWDGETGERLFKLFLERYTAPYTTDNIMEFLGISEE